MAEGLALHTAARTFCIAQHAEWTAKYGQIAPGVKDYLTTGWTYSHEQCKIFPRYRLAEAILINLERFVADSDTSLVDALRVAQEAGQSAYSVLSAELASMDDRAVVLSALREQLDGYSSFLLEAARQRSLEVDPLPYRRVLSGVESDELWQMLSEQWHVRGPGSSWFPLSDDPAPNGVLTFHQELWEARKGEELLQSFLEAERIKRCLLLRELGPPNYEVDAALVSSAYDGSEKFLFSGRDWILYSSHESSLTLAGRLAAFFRDAWPNADQLSYGGPFHTPDLRGTWY